MLAEHVTGSSDRTPKRISESDAKTESVQGLPRTYVRNLRRTTHLGEISLVEKRAQGGQQEFPLAEVNPATAAAPRGLKVVAHA